MLPLRYCLNKALDQFHSERAIHRYNLWSLDVHNLLCDGVALWEVFRRSFYTFLMGIWKHRTFYCMDGISGF
jgi:hypothetical protein